MAKSFTLLAFLGAEIEPTAKSYNEVVDELIKDPRQISGLTEDNVPLSTHSHRLARVFRGLRSFAQKNPKSPTTVIMAAETLNLLVRTLSSLHQLLLPSLLLEVLVPALEICFISHLRPALRNLASVLASCGTLFEYLAADRVGSEIIRQWACSRETSVLDAESLEAWTERLVDMVRSCMGNHNVEEAIQRWVKLLALKTSLRSVEHNISKTSGPSENLSEVTNPRGLPSLGRMTKLSREDKKTRLAGNQTSITSFPTLVNDDQTILKVFGLQVPGSWSTLTHVIKCLEDEKTLAIFLSIVSSFPCNLCNSRLSSSSYQVAGARKKHDSIGTLPNVYVEVMDKKIDIWQISMSPQAVKSFQHLGSHGLSRSATEKLRYLASGSWNPALQHRAGSKIQRNKLRIPVSRTDVGQKHSILWQVDIGMDGDTEVPQQDIKIWEVCEFSNTPKILDRVIFLQAGYSDEAVSRCRQRPSTVDGVQIPVRFDDDSCASAASTPPSTDLDVRTVDPDTIELANKQYAVTEQFIRSIHAKNLSAEFPFELSKEEARVVRHFHTSSLILGRSGTGKTTCLVFKMVRKYLASKAVMDARPVRQILLTRSPYLADKLRAYTRRLIETLSPESCDPESLQYVEQVSSLMTEVDFENEDVSTLSDESFPLVCTWDQFLRLLENTMTAFDRQSCHDADGPLAHRMKGFPGTNRHYRGQVVDGYAFQLDYWPRFSHTLTKDISGGLAFAEMMGTIKGSASRNSIAPLSREEYLTRSCRLAPTFVLEAERSRVYDIFEMYETQKTERGEVDYVDRAVKILQAVRRDPSLNRILRSTFDEVYIDEIQDQRCIDIELLLSFIRDGRGFHFAGDTAQAISQDSTFRFSDIKNIFFQHFSAASVSTNQRDLARPEMFTLSKNYRSHQGILALASLVMWLISQAFPDTVDKLPPEIGSLNGPNPVLFVGVDYNILCSSNVGHTSLSAGTADFGAEQVILVRDASMKTDLQDQIGDVALILTIPESKGMEFDDVILWNFFTDCSDQAGLRSLETLKNEPAKFDSRKQVAMCPELKHLYVAITRARVHLFIMEGSESTTASVLKFLSGDTSTTLLEVTGANCEDFAVRVEMLRPGTSLDPQKWYRRATELMHGRMYKDALRCFRKANDAKGETTAEAHLLEEDGRRCNALNDIEGYTRNLGAAIDLFKKVELFGDVVRLLATLGRLQEAAELCFEQKLYARASPLFAEAGLYAKAADCHRILKQHGEAVSMLFQGSLFDQMVSYLEEYHGYLNPETLQRYTFRCKLLLKQNKVSPEYRSRAIRLLGSSDDQEKYFLQYGMDEELAGFYASQLRYEDLFRLHSRKGHLEQALEIAITKNLLQTIADGLETEVLSLLDYVWIGHLQKSRQQQSAVPLKLPPGFLTPNVILRAEHWEASNLGYSMEGSIARQYVASMESTMPKTILCLRKILGEAAITKTTRLDDLPFEMIHEAIKFAKDLTLGKGRETVETMFLLAGLWKPTSSNGDFSVLPWSPLREALTDTCGSDPTKAVTQQILDRLVPAILAFDAKARHLFWEKWPTYCFRLVTIGFCYKKRKGEECHQVHQLISADDCSRKIDDLLQINNVFCDLAVLYYRRCANEKFQENYLGIKRYWLERLLREITYLSSAEQNTSAIMKTRTELSRDKRIIAVSSFLEDLLYFRLGKEWNQRSNFTSLLEQMQLAKALGSNVQTRLFRAVSHRLFNDKRHLMQRHLGQLNALRQNLGLWDAPIIQRNLKLYLRNLDNIDVPALSTLHSLTAVFEYFVTYLILKTCATACVIPNSWIDLHVASFGNSINSATPLPENDKHRYQECLIDLAKSFCYILSRLNQAELKRKSESTKDPEPTKDFLLCSGTSHPSMLLRQRNADLIAITIANLAAISREPPAGFNDVWVRAKEVFEFPFIKAIHLRSRTPAELTQKLAPSFDRYYGKDVLVVVVKDRKKAAAFSLLEQQNSVRTVSFDELCPPALASMATDDSSNQNPIGPPTDEAHEQYTTTETDAIVKIQRLWRSCSLKITKRRSYVSVPECRATARFFNLSAQCSTVFTSGKRKAAKKLLVSHGVALYLRLDTAKHLLSTLQTDATTCLNKMEISQGIDESLDDILCRNRDDEVLLDKAENTLSDECITGAVEKGGLPALEEMMKNTEDFVAEAEESMLGTRKMVDALLPKCT